MRIDALRRQISLTIVGCVLASTLASAQDAFKKGMDARKDKKWAAAAAALREAIASDSKESPKKVGALGVGKIAVGGDEYLPHFFLGDSLFSLGDCGGALSAWEESDRQGVARKLGNNGRTIDDGYKACEEKGFLRQPKFGQALQESRAALVTVRDVGQRVIDDSRVHPEALTPEVREQLRLARARYEAASANLTTAERTRKAQDFKDSQANATASLQQYQAAKGAVDAVAARAMGLARRSKAAEDALQSAENTSRELDAAIAAAPVKISVPDAVAADAKKAKATLAGVRDKLKTGAPQTDADLAEATRVAGQSGAALESVRGQVDKLIKAAVDREFSALRGSGTDSFSILETRARAVEKAMSEHPPDPKVAKDFGSFQASLAKARKTFDQAVRARDLPAARAAALAPAKLTSQFEPFAALIKTGDVLTVPESLKSGAQALFDGRYSAVLSILTPDTVGSIDVPLRVHAHVLRAAALFALYAYSGSSDDVLQAQARHEVELCRSLDAAFRPSAAAFAPAFIDFFLAASTKPVQ